jgi:tetratricopeptide (TPR) repeat protein
VLSVLEANDLLEEAEALHRTGKYEALVQLLHASSDDALYSNQQFTWLLARGYVELGDHTRALGVMMENSNQSGERTNSRSYRRCLNLQASLHVFFGDLIRAESMFLEVVTKCMLADDQGILAEATLNLGVIADIRTNWNQAIAAYQRAMIPLQRLGAATAIAHCYHNLAMSLRQIGRYKQSLAHFELALEYYRSSAGEQLVLACESERALLALKMGDVQFAERSARRALDRARAINHKYTEGELLRTLGIIIAECNPHEAMDCFISALKVAVDVGAKMLEAVRSRNSVAGRL